MSRRSRLAVAASLIALLPAGCAHILNTLDGVKVGMTREEAVQAVNSPGPTSFKRDSTEYLLYQVGASFIALYSEHPNSVLFVRLENGAVVAKGVVGRREEAQIRRVDPTFELRKYQMP